MFNNLEITKSRLFGLVPIAHRRDGFDAADAKSAVTHGIRYEYRMEKLWVIAMPTRKRGFDLFDAIALIAAVIFAFV